MNLYIVTFFAVALSFLVQDLRAEQFGQSPSMPVFHDTPRELIVRLRSAEDEARLNVVSMQLGASSVRSVFSRSTRAGTDSRLSRNYLIRFRKEGIIRRAPGQGRFTDLNQLRKQYKSYPWVEAVEVNSLNQFFAKTESRVIPSDPDYPKQWNLSMLNLPKAWGIEQGVATVIIAVVDSGLDIHHPELRSQLWRNPGEISDNGVDDDENGYVDDVNGWDFSDAPTLQGHGDWITRDNRPDDETGHGTHVAGIIAAETDNGIGIAGIAWHCRLMPLRAGFVSGTGAFLQNDDVAAAIVYAADNGAQIISMSWGDTVNAFIVQDAVNYAYRRGCILVAASGNSGGAVSYYPAALKTVVSVAALEKNGRLWANSHFGATIDIAAPGDEILSTVPGGDYDIRSGTSMAAPHVSGVVALMLSANPTCSNTEIFQLLTANSLYPLEILAGAGLLDAHVALIASTGLIARLDVKREVTSQRSGVETLMPFDRIQIFGSAGGAGFAEYRLEFGYGETPRFWHLLGIPQTQPRFNTMLYEWDVSTLAEGNYTLRLRVKPKNGITVSDKVIVEVSRTAPTIFKHESAAWFVNERIEPVIIWQTDVLTRGEIEIGAVLQMPGLSENQRTRVVTSDSVNTRHLIYLSDFGVPPGEYVYRLIAQNRAGIQRFDDNNGNLYQLALRDNRIRQAYFSQRVSINRNLHAIKGADMNSNGKVEIIAVETDAASGSPPHIFEVDADGDYQQLFTLREPMHPWATADTDMDGLIEVLGHTLNGTFLLEQAAPGQFPTQCIWNVRELWGGKIADIDADGIPEIFSRHTPTNAIAVYEASGNNTYHNIALFENPTQGNNTIGTNFATGDFDGDGRMEILAGDTDAELFVYEAIANNRYRLKWSGELTEGIPQLFAAGDMDGDGRDEFAVGAKAWTTESNPERHHWRITLFSAATPQGNSRYNTVWNQRIQTTRSGGSGITIADADNDGRNELCIAVPPNFYLIQYNGTNYVPIWHHSANSTLNPIIADLDNDGLNEVLFSDNHGLSIFDLPHAQQTSLPAPWGVIARPVDETSIRIEWHASEDAKAYTIYRGDDARASGLYPIRDKVKQRHFIDSALKTSRTYWYAVASQDSAGQLSPKSTAVSVIPRARPKLISATYSPPNQLLLKFDKSMSNTAARSGQYLLRQLDAVDVTDTITAPQSAILDKSQRRVVLTFPAQALRLSTHYQIEALHLTDIHGAPIADDARMLTITRGAETLTDAIVYPNPTRCEQVTFDKLPEFTRIGIYDLGGNRIASFDTTASDSGRKVWYPVNVSSGVYIYVLETDRERRVGKLSIIR